MYKKKLIEVALPLDDINRASVRENYIYKGNPSSIHKWWAQRPLAACRAVLFASLVDDPSAHPDKFPTEGDQTTERERLFDIIRDLVKWENSNNPEVLDAARAEIWTSCDGNPPPVLDPFAGGGSIPLEAQRLGLEAHASDVNPVAVLINKALIEIPPLFTGKPPIHPNQEGVAELKSWLGAQGLAEDVRHYGRWLRDQAQERIGHLYPRVAVSPELGGGDADPLAYIWVRTVKCPNPACGARTPLASSYVLSSKKNKRRWVVPTVENGLVSFSIGGPAGEPPSPPKLGRGAKFACVACSQAMDDEHIRTEGVAGRLGAQQMAVVAARGRSRIYLAPSDDQSNASQVPPPSNSSPAELPTNPRHSTPPSYGMTRFTDLFTARQLVALTMLSDLVVETRNQIRVDALAAGLNDETTRLRDGGTGATAYAEAITVYLAMAIDKVAEYLNSLVLWYSKEDRPKGLFARQAIPMVWDFTELNPLGEIGGTVQASVRIVAEALENVPMGPRGVAEQLDVAGAAFKGLVSTDPPYYDNVPYADLSDFFYVWLRRSLTSIYPDEFSTLLVPKTQELVADSVRHGGKRASESHFEGGMATAFKQILQIQDHDLPLTVYYAFKQAETTEGATASTGWETMLRSLLDAGFLIDGTWPMRSERSGRMRDIGSNALATSIVLVCRHRPPTASLATRREFIDALKAELPSAVRTMQHGNIAPVDLAQASIGPGMAVFSRYSKVVEADGQPMRVRTALELINQVLDDTVAGSDADFDADTRWATTWFEDCGMNEGDFGRAEQLTKSRNTSVKNLADAGIVAQRPGKVRLKTRDELPDTWDPTSDDRLTVWEITQQLIRLQSEGEKQAADLLRTVGSGYGETAKELAYRLYLVCERKGWAKEAIAYNGLVTAWPELTRLAATKPSAAGTSEQASML